MTTGKSAKIRGTREWAVAAIDCCTGCSHGCRYCYARYDAVVRHKTLSAAGWGVPKIDLKALTREYPLYPGQVMFPASHDIQPEIVDDCILLLEKLLEAGNTVLVVSKPHLRSIEKICDTFKEKKQALLFRFSITAQDGEILRFWEPAAPLYAERLTALRYAHEHGFQTSVSVEPMLASGNIEELVAEVAPFVTHSIWIGKMNRIGERVEIDSAETAKEVQRIEAGQSDEKIRALYQRLQHHELVRWKESIKEVVGLKLPDRAGLDL
ncbi:MAG: radical SAM protein [Desulfopila sp.]|jgi:DNA repair photolyase|nr:radical SAM protein [Desulfopila sp.]